MMHVVSGAFARAHRGLPRPSAPLLLLVALSLFVVRGIVRWSGFSFVGDWVPVGSAYVDQVISPWNLLQQGGTFNQDLRLAWLFVPLGHLAGTPGSWTFALFNSLFLAVVALFPVATAYRTFARVIPGRSALHVVLALFYGLNPWVTAQNASGHVGIVLAYGLLVFVVFPPPGSATVKALRQGLLIALTFALDPHMGVVAVLCVLSTMVVRRLGLPAIDPVKNQISTMRDVLVTAVAAVAVSLYWIVPNLLMVTRLAFVPVEVPEEVSTISSLARLNDLFHLAALRSFWWEDFSDGFYGDGAVGAVIKAALIVGPLGLVVMAVVSHDVRRVSALPVLWTAVPLILTQWAYHFPATYTSLVSLPGGALLRDANVTLPFAVLALCALACVVDPVQHRARATVLVAVTVAASLAPWHRGHLNGYLAPLRAVGSQATAVSWLNARAGSTSLTLWLPASAYIATDWSGGRTITDPVRFWTTTPVLNPLQDPAHDFVPTTTLATEGIVSMIEAGKELDKLGRMLAVAGVQYVVVRRDAQPHSLARRYAQSLRQARGVRLVRRFETIDVFAMPRAAGRHATISAEATLFGGAWNDLAQVLEIDPLRDRSYVDLRGIADEAPELLADGGTTIVTDNHHAAALTTGRSHTVPDARHRERLLVGNENMYLHDAGEAVSWRSDGVFAAQVLALNEDVVARCDGRGIATPEIYEQPDVGRDRYTPRWIGVTCRGTASLRFRGPAWVGSIQTLSLGVFEQRLAAILRLVTHPGSAYMLHADQFAVVGGAARGLSRYENPLFLPPGEYRLRLECKNACPAARIRVVAAADLRPASAWLPSGSRLTIASQPADTPLRNEYRVEIRGLTSTLFQPWWTLLENLYIERVPASEQRLSPSAGTVRATEDSVTFTAPGPRAVLTLARSPAPWRVSGDSKTLYGPLTANIYGNALGVTPGSGRLSLGYLRSVQIAVSAGSAAAVLAVLVYLVFRPRDQRRQGRRRASTTGHP